MSSRFPVKGSWQHYHIMKFMLLWVDVVKCLPEDIHILNLNQIGISEGVRAMFVTTYNG